VSIRLALCSRKVVIAVALAVASGACSSRSVSSTPSAGPPDESVTVGAATPNSIGVSATIANSMSSGRLPAEEILLEARLAPTDDQYDAWQIGTTTLINRCLMSQGFEAVASRPGADERRLAWEATLDRLYFDDREAVSTVGYQFGEPPMSFDDLLAPSANEEAADPVLQEAADACAAPARDTFTRLATVLGDGSDLSTLALGAQAQIFAEMGSAPELVEVSEALEECIVTAGFPSSGGQSAPGATAPLDEALADFDCRLSTGYTDAKVAWLARRVDAWVEQNPTVVSAILEFNRGLAEAGIGFSSG
jgi:hypothetical protein